MDSHVRYRLVAAGCGLLGIYFIASFMFTSVFHGSGFVLSVGVFSLLVICGFLRTAWVAWHYSRAASTWYTATMILLTLEYVLIASADGVAFWWLALPWFGLFGYVGRRLLKPDQLSR